MNRKFIMMIVACTIFSIFKDVYKDLDSLSYILGVFAVFILTFFSYLLDE